MPQIGDKCTGKDLGYKTQEYMPYVWTKCPVCKYTRWVQDYYLTKSIVPGICQKCASWKSNSRHHKKPPNLHTTVPVSISCTICTVRIGSDYEEKVPHELNGKIVCSHCLNDNKILVNVERRF